VSASNVVPPSSAAPLSVRVRRTFSSFTLDVHFESTLGVTALLGPSGAGKTLTLRAIAGLLTPHAGRIAVGDAVLFDHDARINVSARARRVGYVFQHFALFPHLSVAENVAYGLHGQSREQQQARVSEMLSLVDLSSYAGRQPRGLSGGQQQRVALARALAPAPTLLLLDEPFASLDVPLRTRLGEQLRALHERTRIPMVLVTHDPHEAARIADAVVHIDDGHVSGDRAPR
jgi:ABC-type sulfate/molybdate transport systems ATPase subunit